MHLIRPPVRAVNDGEPARQSYYRRQLRISLLLLAVVIVVGDIGYMLIEGWPLLDGLYMTVITLSTIGYGEVHPLSIAGRIFTIVLIITSLSIVGYAITNLSRFVLEGELNSVVWGLRMKNQIDKLHNHVILCGGGRTGRHAATEFNRAGVPFVVIEQDPLVIEQLRQSVGDGLLYLQADATQDDTLLLAGVARARGLVAALGQDKDNVFVVLSARALNPELLIVSRLLEDANADKLRKAGADNFVSDHVIGGFRLASEVLRPNVVDFMEKMLQDSEGALRLEEFQVKAGGALAGRTLGELDLGRCTGMLIVAIRPREGGYKFNPGAQSRLDEGDILIAMGTPEQVYRLQGLASNASADPDSPLACHPS